jgi:LemA protein
VLAVVVVVVVLAVLLAGMFVVSFNRLQRARQAVREAWAQIDVMLARRYRLITDLAAVTAGAAAFERTASEALVAARDRAAHLGDAPEVRGRAEEQVDHEVHQVVARIEALPELRAEPAFARLRQELVAAEDDVSAARRYYNGRVRLYHTARESFPAVLVASSLGFRPAEYFQAEREEREVPNAR